MASASFTNVVMSYGKVQTIHGIGFDIKDGEFIALVGPSGCGKSTLLRMVAGLEEVSGGEIAIGGQAINDIDPKDRDIAMVFQNYALYPHMTVGDNMGFSLKLRKVDAALVERRVIEAARLLNLEGLLQRYPRELSGGQRQRVAMGRAIVRKPKIFLFDEPLSNLDAKLRVSMRSEIKALHQRLGVTTIYVTHDQVEAMTMADRIVVMNAGRIEQIGAPLELFDLPRNRFVAEFIGSPSMNFVEGVIEIEEGRTWVRSGAQRWPLARAGGARVGHAVHYGIRASDLSIGVAASGIAATVQVVEPTGSETSIVLQAGLDTFSVTQQGRTAAIPGELVGLHVDAEKVHLFDAKTGQRLDHDLARAA